MPSSISSLETGNLPLPHRLHKNNKDMQCSTELERKPSFMAFEP
ncbi:hypothetical protein [Pseudomonas morbosilactucae]|nr:hypothetical protein [Pseudomonas morbosilactucae]